MSWISKLYKIALKHQHLDGCESIFGWVAGEPGSIRDGLGTCDSVLHTLHLAFPLLPEAYEITVQVLLQHHHNIQIIYNNNQPTFPVSRVRPQILGHQTSIRPQRRCHTLREMNLSANWLLRITWFESFLSMWSPASRIASSDTIIPFKPHSFSSMHQVYTAFTALPVFEDKSNFPSTSKHQICNPVIWLQATLAVSKDGKSRFSTTATAKRLKNLAHNALQKLISLVKLLFGHKKMKIISIISPSRAKLLNIIWDYHAQKCSLWSFKTLKLSQHERCWNTQPAGPRYSAGLQLCRPRSIRWLSVDMYQNETLDLQKWVVDDVSFSAYVQLLNCKGDMKHVIITSLQ